MSAAGALLVVAATVGPSTVAAIVVACVAFCVWAV
jgi:hypothetical protein